MLDVILQSPKKFCFTCFQWNAGEKSIKLNNVYQKDKEYQFCASSRDTYHIYGLWFENVVYIDKTSVGRQHLS